MGQHEDHAVLVDILVFGAIAQLERGALMSENSEPERSIETLRRSLAIAHRQDDSLQPFQCCSTLQYFAHQAPCDALAALRFVHKHSPNSRFVPLLQARVASEPDGAHQTIARKGAYDIILFAGG